MPEPRFKGDPYQVLDVPADASAAQIKRRWRELAREHHPDKAAGDSDQAEDLTGRMARINAAYDLLRDPVRRATFDQSPAGRRARQRAGRSEGGLGFEAEAGPTFSGPPPPPPTRPVTARFDTSAVFRPRNTTIGGMAGYPSGYRSSGYASSAQRARRMEPDDLRASTPSGPVERRRSSRPPDLPSLQEARETVLAFGKHRGYTLGEVELLEPTYIDWIAQTITRDRDLVVKARVIQGEMDRQGVVRRVRPAVPGFGSRPASAE